MEKSPDQFTRRAIIEQKLIIAAVLSHQTIAENKNDKYWMTRASQHHLIRQDEG